MKSVPPDDPLESALRRDAARLTPPVPAGMERRISLAVDHSGRPAPRIRPFYVGSALAAAGLAAAAIIVSVRPAKPVPDPAADRAAAAQLAQAVKAMPAQIWDSVQPKAAAVLQDEPLRQEATALYSDAQSALGFLALNFLPASPPGPTPRRG